MNTSKQRASVVAAIVLAVVVVGLAAAVAHQKVTKYRLLRDVRQQTTRLAGLERDLSNRAKWRNDYQNLSLKLGAGLQNFTWSDQMPFMVTQLTGIVEAQGLKIASLQPEEMTSGEHILRFPLRVALNCDLSDLTKILQEIESTKPVLNVERLDVRTSPDESGKLQVGMTVSSFVVRDDHAAPTKRRSSGAEDAVTAGGSQSSGGST